MRIEANRLSKAYNGRTVLDIDGLVFESGGIYAVLGHNGSGKTTLLRIISGLEAADSGKVLYDGSVILPHDDISFLIDKPYIFDLTVMDNMLIGVGKSSSGRKIAEEALRYLGMGNFAQAGALTLSGGEAQKTAIARTLILQKKLVLLDEPASYVDIPSMKLIEEFIVKVSREHRATVIFTTHNPSQALRVADKVVIMNEGRLMDQGDPESVLVSCRKKSTEEFLQDWRV